MRCRLFAFALFVAVLAAVAARSAPAAAAESASALLEKGIYTEETVGDLDAAAKLYQEAVAEARKAEAVAAQAQYRLGLCLLKQKKDAEAVAEFKKLVEAYPDQTDWVAKAKKHIPGEAGLPLGKIPWKDGEFMQLAVRVGEMRVGAMVWAVESSKLDGKDVCGMTLHRYVGEINSGVSHVDADPKTSQPIKSEIRNPILGSADAIYKPGEVIVTTRDHDGKKSVRTERLDKVYYDQEEACQVLRRLPLAVGYKGVLPLFVPAGAMKLDLPFEVSAKKTLQVPAGKFECYKIPLSTINQTLWYSTDAHHYLVRLDAANATIALEQLGLNVPGKTRTREDKRMGCSFAVPAGWYSYETTQGNVLAMFVLLDPEELAINSIDVYLKSSDEKAADPANAVRAYAEAQAANRGKELKNYKIRPDSWKTFTVGGLPAVSVVGDYMVVQQPKSDYTVCVMGKTSKAQLRVGVCAPDELDGLRSQFDKIVATLKIK